LSRNLLQFIFYWMSHLRHLQGLAMQESIFLLLWLPEMSPDPDRAYFWLAVNKRPTCLWPKEIFWSEGEKMEKIGTLRRNFLNADPNQRWLTQPDPSNKKLIQSHHPWPNGHGIWLRTWRPGFNPWSEQNLLPLDLLWLIISTSWLSQSGFTVGQKLH